MATTANGRSARVRKFTTRGGVELQFTELGFGGAPLGNLYRPMTEKEARVTLEAVWAAGCRYFDTAPLYGLGLSETRLNGFLRPKPRGSYLISTKVGRLLDLCEPQKRSGQAAFFETPSRRERFDYSYDGVMRSLEFSLERLGLDHVDIVYCHDVDVFTHGSREAADARIKEFMEGGYRALDQLRASGTVKAIGAGVKGEARYNYSPASDEVKDRVRRIQQICKSFKVALPEAALRFPLGHPAVVSVIAGAQHASEVRRNVAMMGTKLPAGLWRALKTEKLLREDAPTPR